jgi:hypothetical protein
LHRIMVNVIWSNVADAAAKAAGKDKRALTRS